MPDSDPKLAAQIALRQAYVDGVIAVAKGSIDRIRAGATAVVTAASAIATVYGAVLGVAFAATNGTVLPPRGLIAPVFLGLAIVFATAYLAVPSEEERKVDPPEITDDLNTTGDSVANAFVKLNSTAALVNRQRLVASVIALALGTAFLPAPFISFAKKPSTPSATTSTTATTTTASPWPQPDQTVTDSKLASILYTAQVAEAARKIKASDTKAVPGKGHDGLWWMAGGAGIVLVLLVGLGPWFKGDKNKHHGIIVPMLRR